MSNEELILILEKKFIKNEKMHKKNDKYVYCNISIESSDEKRRFCYDIDALNSRKSNKLNLDIITEANNNKVKVLD